MEQKGSREDKRWGGAGGVDGVELGVGGELEGVAGDGAVGGVEVRAARAPERLKDVLDRLLGPRARASSGRCACPHSAAVAPGSRSISGVLFCHTAVDGDALEGGEGVGSVLVGRNPKDEHVRPITRDGACLLVEAHVS